MPKRVLSLGLKFIPTSSMEQDSIRTAFTRFRRGNRLKHFYRDQPPTEPHPFRSKSQWDPPPASVEIEQYLNRVSEGLQNLTTLQVSDNLSRAEHRALQSLSNNPDLVIKNADKGSGIVVEDRESYIKDGLAHLSDENIYKNIDHDPTTMLAKASNTFTHMMYNKGVIDSITRDYLHQHPP